MKRTVHNEIEERTRETEFGLTDDLRNEAEHPVAPESPEIPLLTIFWEASHTWADSTTFHGIRYVFDRDSHIVRRAVWLIMILAMVFILVWNGQTQINRYFKYNTLTIRTVSVHEKLQIPSVTICNRRFIRNDSISNDTNRILLEEILRSEPNKTRLVSVFGLPYLNSTSFRDLLMAHLSTLDDFILSCTWKGLPLNCTEYFTSRLTGNGMCSTISAFDTVVAGDTYGLEIVLWSGQDIFFTSEEVFYGVKVLVHEPSDEPNIQLASLIGPGFLHYISVTSHVHDYMPYPVKAFGGQYCIDTEADANLHGHYSVTACYRQCRHDFILKHCGCSSPFESENESENDCSAYQMIDCYQPTLYSFMSQIEKCHCPTPCHMTKYQTKHSSTYLPEIIYKTKLKNLVTSKTTEAMKENVIILKVFYESKEVINHEQILEFTFEDLWASFGGYIGLATGCSFITFMEIVDLFVMVFYRHVRHIRNIGREST